MPSLLAMTQAACSARDEGAAFRVLDTDEAADLAAIAARIFPATDTPGANELGVIYFFDRALGVYLAPGMVWEALGRWLGGGVP